MTAPLDEKALAGAHDAFYATESSNSRDMMRNAITAYLAASPSPSVDMEVVAWLDETADAAPGAKGVTTDAYAAAYWEHTSGAPMTELVRVSQAQSALAALSAQVLRLTDEKEALRKALEPFADFGELMQVETEGFSGTDRLYLVPEESDVRIGDLFVSAFRRARTALGGR